MTSAGAVLSRALDAAALRRVAGRSPSLLRGTASLLSRSAERGLVWWAISALVGCTSPSRRRPVLAGALAWAAATGVANGALKTMSGRHRPRAHLLALPTHGPSPATSSFPSSHAAGAFGYATAALVVDPGTGVVLFGLASAIGWSRLQAARHFPGDVVGGAVVGVVVGATVGVIARRGIDRRGRSSKELSRSRAADEPLR